MDSKLYNGLAIFNECMLVFMGYQMYLFTDYVSAPEKRYQLGKHLLWLVYFDIGLNLVVLGIDIVLKTMHWIKRFFLLRKHRKTVESNNKIKAD